MYSTDATPIRSCEHCDNVWHALNNHGIQCAKLHVTPVVCVLDYSRVIHSHEGTDRWHKLEWWIAQSIRTLFLIRQCICRLFCHCATLGNVPYTCSTMWTCDNNMCYAVLLPHILIGETPCSRLELSGTTNRNWCSWSMSIFWSGLHMTLCEQHVVVCHTMT